VFFYLWLGTTIWLFKDFWIAACIASLILLPHARNHAYPYSSVAGSHLLYTFPLGMVVARIYRFAQGRYKHLL